MTDPRALATVELFGALTYAQLRAFETAAAAIRYAPDVRRAERVASFAVQEHAAWERLRDRLRALTDLPEPPLDRQKPRVDGFFDGLPIDDWLSACTFFAIGLPMAGDFAGAVAPALDEDSGRAVTEALATREAFGSFAMEQVSALIEQDPSLRERTRRLAAEITGSALTEFQGAITDTDALLVLLESLEATGEDDLLRRTVVSLLDQHRRRMVAIGVDTL